MKKAFSLLLILFVTFALAFTNADGATSTAPAPELKETDFGVTLYTDKDGLLIRLDTVRYSVNNELSFDITIRNDTKYKQKFTLVEAYVNKFLVQTDFTESYTIDVNETFQKTIRVTNVQTDAFRSINAENIEEIRLSTQFLNEKSKLKSIFTSPGVNPYLSGPRCEPEKGQVIFDDDTITVRQISFDGTTGKAQIRLDKKDSSRWTSVNMDCVYDGCGLGRFWFDLQKGYSTYVDLNGVPAMHIFGMDAIKTAEVYLTYYHSDRIREPVRVTLNTGAVRDPFAQTPSVYGGRVIFESENVVIRSVGVSSEFFTDCDCILLQMDNKTDRNFSLYQQFDYMLLDGTRVEARMDGANVFPHCTAVMALYPYGGVRSLSSNSVAKLTLGIYVNKNGYHKLVESTNVVEIPLRPAEVAF